MAKKNLRLLAPLFCLVGAITAEAIPCAWAFIQTQDLKGVVVDEKEKPIVGAVCTLSGRSLPDEGLTVASGETGEFNFPGLPPASYDLTCAAVGYQPVLQKGLEVTDAGAPSVQVMLPNPIIHRDTVEVHEQASKISQQSSARPATLTTSQLNTLPLTQQKFKAALPLVPGVVRTPDGKTTIKGSIENQGMLLVDLAETVDPVTGSFSIDVPIDAVESLEVFKSAYRAEYGRFSGGLTTIQTKAPSHQWHFELNDFLPSLRVRSGHIVGIADDRPRLSFTGPIWKNKLNLAESFTYDMLKQPVRGLAWPHNESKRQGFNSFTTFQFLVSSHHLINANANVFPMRVQFADINSLVPQSASSDYGQRGYSIALTDRYLLSSGAIITTLAKYIDFSSYAHGQGPEHMRVTPNGWGGNFFNAWTRASKQQEVLQSFQFAPKHWRGSHDVKIGGNLVHRTYTGASTSHPVLLLRADRIVRERIDFMSPASLNAEDTEVGAFLQDHWAFNDHLALDAGVRYAGQTLGDKAAFVPRFGIVYSPATNGKTILRGGVGVFFDRVPLLAGDFTQNPSRVISFFGPGEALASAPEVFRYRYERVLPNSRRVVPSRNRLDSTPHNLTWNMELDQEITPRVTLRLSYLSSRTYDVFVVDPIREGLRRPAVLLSNTGGSRYHEFESTVRFHASQSADLNVSYVRSLARGDLNTLAQTFVPFEQPVIRPNIFANQAANVPHRLVAWGRFRIPREVTLSPVIDLHSGFPFSAVDVLQNYVGEPNSRRLPTFFSLDLKLTKDFRLPFIPLVKSHKLRGGFEIFNVTNHANPRDVFNNVASPFFGRFVGFQHRFYDVSLDIVY